MNQSERRRYLIQELIKENTQYNNLEIPQNKEEQKQLLRSLMNIRFACPISDEFKQIQDEYLTEENKNRDRKSTRLNSSHIEESRMPSSA